MEYILLKELSFFILMYKYTIGQQWTLQMHLQGYKLSHTMLWDSKLRSDSILLPMSVK